MTFWAALGWLGNVGFFSRFFVQWLASERAGRSVAPQAFWWLSLLGSACLGAYTYHGGEPVLFAGHLLNGGLFARNLWLSMRPRAARESHWGLGIAALVLMASLIWLGMGRARGNLTEAPVWLTVSLLGQLIWSSRFVLQWWESERKGMSHFPVLFWWISLVGNGLLLAYSAHVGDPVLIAGYVPGPLVQIRNLMLGQSPLQHTTEEATPPGEAS